MSTNPTIQLAKKLFAVQQQQEIKEKVAAIQAADPSLSFVSAWDKLRAAEPELYGAELVHGVEMGEPATAAAGFSPTLPGNGAGTPVDEAEAARQRKIQALVEQVLKDHPGLAFKTAYLTVQHENPKLFPGEDAETLALKDRNQKKQAVINDEIEKLRRAEPHLNFSTAWHKLQKEKPGMFDFESV